MTAAQKIAQSIFEFRKEDEFNALCLELFHWQYMECSPYGRFCEHVLKRGNKPSSYDEIPFLPIEFFKTERVISRGLHASRIFESSGTTGMELSKHLVHDLALYEKSFDHSFSLFYGDPSDWCILALLPSYLERSNSSLVYMADALIRKSSYEESGFYLNEYEKLSSVLQQLNDRKVPTLLLGVSFALLDLAEKLPQSLPHITIMETGGMKGRRKELIREELHEVLCSAFSVSNIHSEYGMTELLSQAYSKGDGRFHCPPWMKVLAGDMYDPHSWKGPGETGVLHVIDLANIYSCSFIRTADLCRVYEDGSFEVLGRMDQAEMRGCNLMI